MHRLALLLLLATWLTHPLAAQDAPMPASTTLTQPLRIASYNLKNALDLFDDPWTLDEVTPPKPRAEWEQIAAVLRHVNADIVALQEVENEPLLKAARDELFADLGYTHLVACPTNDRRGIRVAVLSRFPITSITSHCQRSFTHPDEPDAAHQFARDFPHVRIDMNGTPLHLFPAHFKSNYTSRDEDPHAIRQRTAAAMEARTIVQNLLMDDPDALVAVCGDFNSDCAKQKNDTRPWPATQVMLSETDGIRLTDCHAHLDRKARITIPAKGKYPPRVFDYILVSPALTKYAQPEAARVFQPRHAKGAQTGITHGSDHYILWADFLPQ